MQWHTHVSFGLATLWILQAVPGALGPDRLPAVILCAALGSLLPDLDAAESKLKSLSLGGVRPFALPAQAVHRRWGHRGFTHSLPGLAAVVPLALLPVPWLGWQGGVALMLGYASHLAADAMTRTGIPFLYPSRRRYWLLPRRLRVVTGSPAEDIVFALAAVAALMFLLLHLPLAA